MTIFITMLLRVNYIQRHINNPRRSEFDYLQETTCRTSVGNILLFFISKQHNSVTLKPRQTIIDIKRINQPLVRLLHGRNGRREILTVSLGSQLPLSVHGPNGTSFAKERWVSGNRVRSVDRGRWTLPPPKHKKIYGLCLLLSYTDPLLL